MLWQEKVVQKLHNYFFFRVFDPQLGLSSAVRASDQVCSDANRDTWPVPRRCGRW